MSGKILTRLQSNILCLSLEKYWKILTKQQSNFLRILSFACVWSQYLGLPGHIYLRFISQNIADQFPIFIQTHSFIYESGSLQNSPIWKNVPKSRLNLVDLMLSMEVWEAKAWLCSLHIFVCIASADPFALTIINHPSLVVAGRLSALDGCEVQSGWEMLLSSDDFPYISCI